MKTDKVSFTSKINFVDAKTFDKFRRGVYVDFRPENNISDRKNAILPWFKKYIRHDVVKADEFYTDQVRTCTAGGVIDTKTGQCAGFHFFDSLDNALETKQMLGSIFRLVPNPDRALILGGKRLSFANYSLPIFEEILQGLKAKIDNVTVFKEHLFPHSESHLHYSLKDDTWTINSVFRYKTNLLVDHNIDERNLLNKCFNEIEIADGDSLNFIDI